MYVNAYYYICMYIVYIYAMQLHNNSYVHKQIHNHEIIIEQLSS